MINGTHLHYLLRFADDALVLGHRLSQWSSRAPTLEEDIALSNIALDLIGQARTLYQHASAIGGGMRDEDAFAYLREPHEFRNVLLVEQPNGDFAHTMARQLYYSAFAEPHWAALRASRDGELSGVAAKAEKECAYHLRHAAEWVIRLGDGTDESRHRMQAAIDALWPFTGELFESDETDKVMIAAGIGIDAGKIRAPWRATIAEVIDRATLTLPSLSATEVGGRTGRHSTHLTTLLTDMQVLARTHPGARW